MKKLIILMWLVLFLITGLFADKYKYLIGFTFVIGDNIIPGSSIFTFDNKINYKNINTVSKYVKNEILEADKEIEDVFILSFSELK